MDLSIYLAPIRATYRLPTKYSFLYLDELNYHESKEKSFLIQNIHNILGYTPQNMLHKVVLVYRHHIRTL